LLDRAEQRPVFIKDMSYYVVPHILSDEVFGKRLVNCFLIRDPVAAISSYFKLDPDATLDEIGLEAQWRHYEALVAKGEKPVVIDAETVRRDTRGTMAALWTQIGLPFSEAAFDWQEEKPKDWEQVGAWHADVMQSKAIRPITDEEIAAQWAKFDRMAEKHPQMRSFLAHHQPFYDRLKAVALAL
jgi:hypothetical protein